MSSEKINIARLLEYQSTLPILDVRSPAEYGQAHIPGAISFPLFSNEERKVVGTAYKQQSRETAIKIGLDIFGPKMRSLVEKAEQIASTQSGSSKKSVIVHCWRGGMRSAAVAWLLDLYGFKVYTVNGGYKAYRHWVINTYSRPFAFHVLGGYTGSGKTYILKQLEQQQQPVLHLEDLANHKGSAFGNIGMPAQPSQEMFENLLGYALWKLSVQFPDIIHPTESRAIWVEDESQRIGDVNLPIPFYRQMKTAPVFFVDIPFEQRLNNILAEYGQLDRERMKSAISRIQKRLGPLETKLSLQHLENDETLQAFDILLKYYDKWYRKSLNNRENLEEILTTITCHNTDPKINADRVLQTCTQYDKSGINH